MKPKKWKPISLMKGQYDVTYVVKSMTMIQQTDLQKVVMPHHVVYHYNHQNARAAIATLAS